MERFSFAPEAAFVPRGDLLDHVTLAPLTPSSSEGALVQAVILRFEPGGRLRRHPASFPQIIAVLEESGEVRGANGVDEPIGAGEAIFLHEGEDHERRLLKRHSRTLGHRNAHSPGEPRATEARFRCPVRFCQRSAVPIVVFERTTHL